MKALYFLTSLLLLALPCKGAVTVRAGTNIANYPNISSPSTNARYVLELPGVTNYNISHQQLKLNMTQGLATVTFVTNLITVTSNSISTNSFARLEVQTNGTRLGLITNQNWTYGVTGSVSGATAILGVNDASANTAVSNGVITQILALSNNMPANLWTNSGGFVMLTTNGPVSIASTGLLGGLVVTQDIRFLGHNSASNSVWVCTNATTGEGEWRASTAAAGFGGVMTNSDTLNIQYEPVRGSTWYSGTNGTPTTNQARAGLEFSPFWRSLRMGEVAAGADVYALVGNGSNYWNDTNIGPLSVGLGSNAFVKAAYASVLGGSYNAVLTNAKFSVIGGGQENLIDTNASASVIAGGGKNSIRTQGAALTDVGNSTISGGSNNVISGTRSRWSTISGGGDNSIDSSGEATIGGGFSNDIELDGRYGFMGGGANNTLGNTGATAGDSEGAALVGGQQNQVQGDNSFVGGGFQNGMNAINSDYCAVVGGQANTIGAGGSAESTHGFIGGGLDCDILNNSHYASIVGGRDNDIGANCTNAFIGGGYLNTFGTSAKFAAILGGERNTIDASYGYALGTSNHVTATFAGALGLRVTNSTVGSVTAGELISYNTPAVIAGAGSGSTNYTLQVTSPKMLLGSSNVNIVAVMQTITAKTHKWSVNITNLSADTWGITFSSATNRWRFQSYMYGTNAPSVLTNNTLLRLNGESEGTNTLVTYEYFSPGL